MCSIANQIHSIVGINNNISVDNYNCYFTILSETQAKIIISKSATAKPLFKNIIAQVKDAEGFYFYFLNLLSGIFEIWIQGNLYNTLKQVASIHNHTLTKTVRGVLH